MTTLTTARRSADGDVAPTSRTVVRPGILPAPGARQWVPACPVSRLVPGRGVAVLLPGGAQAALFLLPNGMIYAVDNLDPYAGAAVISRGLTGDRAGEPTVASPAAQAGLLAAHRRRPRRPRGRPADVCRPRPARRRAASASPSPDRRKATNRADPPTVERPLRGVLTVERPASASARRRVGHV